MNLDGKYIRSQMLLGMEKLAELKTKSVAVFGLGGVGGYVCESLARTGIGTLYIIDDDHVDETNLNRQIIATKNTIGLKKVDACASRISEINPDVKVIKCDEFILKDNIDKVLAYEKTDYIVDCIDTVTGKLGLVMYAKEHNIPIISAMGTGNKIKPEMLEIADIKDTSVCPLCKVMRKELGKLGIEKLKVVYSKETPINSGSRTPGSLAFVPGACGLIIGSVVVRDLLNGFI